MLGLAQGCLNNTVPYTHERKQFGQKIWDFQVRIQGTLYFSGKLLTYPSPKPTSTLTSHLGQNVGLDEGGKGIHAVSQKRITAMIHTDMPKRIHLEYLLNLKLQRQHNINLLIP